MEYINTQPNADRHVTGKSEIVTGLYTKVSTPMKACNGIKITCDN